MIVPCLAAKTATKPLRFTRDLSFTSPWRGGGEPSPLQNWFNLPTLEGFHAWIARLRFCNSISMWVRPLQNLHWFLWLCQSQKGLLSRFSYITQFRLSFKSRSEVLWRLKTQATLNQCIFNVNLFMQTGGADVTENRGIATDNLCGCFWEGHAMRWTRLCWQSFVVG